MDPYREDVLDYDDFDEDDNEERLCRRCGEPIDRLLLDDGKEIGVCYLCKEWNAEADT